MARKVIVFGATGGVGSATALTARQLGAEVSLAMRDISKTIPSLESSTEKESGFPRIQADLAQPDSVRSAVTQTGAQYAFVYTLWGTSDHMRPSFEALKAAGIKSIVLLSSFSVHGDPRSCPTTHLIAWTHAQVEIALQDVFGPDGYVIVRLAFFATNARWWARDIAGGEVRISYPRVRWDFISPDDIGAICGRILVQVSQSEERIVGLVGREYMSMREAIGVIARVLGKEVRVTTISQDECVQRFIAEDGLPEVLARDVLREYDEAGDGEFYPNVPEARGNVERYLQRPPTGFEEWVQQHKDVFVV
ncbi:hypothetical protein BDV25DRAFT_136567 [Aspergillus avenaceus]|uniref:NmrA-like domain-containing protein n=1 Tax=Aspergillus avenaceus TaxID=36643 RepID=A0A5N6U595_ASPAV|nr:hypothetical protein BDV25DRAFT_136567 [Aspergillus avenaceus]